MFANCVFTPAKLNPSCRACRDSDQLRTPRPAPTGSASEIQPRRLSRVYIGSRPAAPGTPHSRPSQPAAAAADHALTGRRCDGPDPTTTRRAHDRIRSRTTPPLAHESGDCFHEATTAGVRRPPPGTCRPTEAGPSRIGGRGPANRQLRTRRPCPMLARLLLTIWPEQKCVTAASRLLQRTRRSSDSPSGGRHGLHRQERACREP